MKKKEERMEKQMAEVITENKRLAEPLQKAREEVEDLRRQLSNYEKDKEILKVGHLFHLSYLVTGKKTFFKCPIFYTLLQT